MYYLNKKIVLMRTNSHYGSVEKLFSLNLIPDGYTNFEVCIGWKGYRMWKCIFPWHHKCHETIICYCLLWFPFSLFLGCPCRVGYSQVRDNKRFSISSQDPNGECDSLAYTTEMLIVVQVFFSVSSSLLLLQIHHLPFCKYIFKFPFF